MKNKSAAASKPAEASKRQFIILDVTDSPAAKRYLKAAASHDHRTLTSFLLAAGFEKAQELKGFRAKAAPTVRKQWRKCA